MLKILRNRFEQGNRTSRYPREPVALPARYRGRPEVRPEADAALAERCAAACPLGALDGASRTIDLGLCVFCGTCERLSEGALVTFTQDFGIGAATREALVTAGTLPDLAAHAKAHFRRLFGRSLQLRQISSAGCNACEADLNVLTTPFFDIARFGIDFVASPRHADAIVVTGPISRNMRAATLATWEAVPAPKACVAVGACAISGGLFRGSPEVSSGLDGILPVDLYIPGCPPHPLTNLHALLRYFR